MIRKVNIFNMGKQPRDLDDQTFEVNFIKNLTSKYNKELEFEPEYEVDLESEDFNLDQIVDSAIEWATNPIPLNQEPKDLIQPSTEPPLSFELKALPNHLKYIYMRGNEALPIIIASYLTEK